MSGSEWAWYFHCFCEENIYRFIEKSNLSKDTLYAVFISNLSKSVALFEQKSAKGRDPVIWDYHVVCIHESETKCFVYDADTRLKCPEDLETYFLRTFPLSIPDLFRPKFRVVPGATFLASFSSDRSHMKSAHVPFPTLAVIQGNSAESSMTLPRFWNMVCDLDSEHYGKVMELEELLKRFSR
jgi:hypothetical protein